MKIIEKISLFSGLCILVGLSLSSCTVEDPVVVTPKTVDQYVKDFGDYVKAEMTFVYKDTVGYAKGDFTPVSKTSYASYKAAYIAALKADSVLISTPGVTIAQLIAANTSLATPGKAFRGKINISDRRQLNDSIIAATAYNASVIVGSAGGNVLQADKIIFTAAITAATATRDASTSIELQIKAAIDALKAAKSTFKATLIPTDLATFISNSTAYVNAQLLIVNKSIAGYDINQYLTNLRTNYLTVLKTDSTLFSVPTSLTSAQVSAAMTNLVTPRTAFVANVSDKRALNDSIIAANAYNSSIPVGTAAGQVSQVAKTTFTTVITTATNARENPLTPFDNPVSSGVQTQTGVKAQIYSLTLAKLKFTAAIIK
jgi:predicted nucleic acid-binding protein